MKLRLTYSHEHVKRPLLAELISKTGALVNILEAKIAPSTGELVIDVPVEGERLQDVISFLVGEGVTVVELTQTIGINLERCIACGACVSPCSVQAITFTDAWEIDFDDEKCIGCGTCVPACPVKAIKML